MRVRVYCHGVRTWAVKRQGVWRCDGCDENIPVVE